MPIREVGRSGEKKNPRGRRKKSKKARTGRLRSELKHKLAAKIYGVELGLGRPAGCGCTTKPGPSAGAVQAQ